MVDLDSGSRFVIIFLKGDLSNMVCDMCVYVNSNLSNIIAINECQSHVLFLRLINWLCKGHFCLQNELLQPFLLYNEVVITETVLMCEMHCSSTKFSKKIGNCKFCNKIGQESFLLRYSYLCKVVKRKVNFEMNWVTHTTFCYTC